MSPEEQMTPQEHAELVRDANALITATETGITRTGFVFVTASTLTIAALALNQRAIGAVVAVVALAALVLATLLVITRVYLGDDIESLTDVSEGASEVAQVAESPATGSAPATPENRVIPTK